MVKVVIIIIMIIVNAFDNCALDDDDADYDNDAKDFLQMGSGDSGCCSLAEVLT